MLSPMLAYPYKEEALSGELFFQPKLDGIRCLATRDGLYTRNNKEILSCTHIRSQLKPFFEKYPDIILDGELYNHDFRDDFNKITSAVRKKRPTEEALLIEYHIYDYMSDKDFSDRIKFLKSSNLLTVETRQGTKEDIEDFNNYFLLGGYEGLMIRTNSPYENRRSRNLYKFKTFDTEEFDLVDLIEGLGVWKGCVKSAILRDNDGSLITSGVRGEKEFLRDLLVNKEEFLNSPRKSTVRFFGRTPKGELRFPIVIDLDRVD